MNDLIVDDRPITYGILKPGTGFPGGIPVVKVKDMKDGMIDQSDLLLTSPEIDANYKRSKLRTGDLLISIRGSVGRMAEIPENLENANITQDTARLSIKPEYNKIYVRGVLESQPIQYDMERNIRGVAVKGINIGYLRELGIPLCDRARQDMLAALYEQSDKSKFICFKSQFIEMFGDPVENPRGWETKGLLELGKCKNGMNFSAGESGVNVHCLGVGDFKDYSEICDTSALPKISLNKMPPKEVMLQDGDIVFVRSNGNKMLVGRCLVIFPGDIPTTYSGFCIRFRKQSQCVDTTYLVQLLKADSTRSKMAGRGANIQNLNQQILGALQIPIPPIELQQEFEDFIRQSDKSKFELKQAIADVDSLARALLQQELN